MIWHGADSACDAFSLLLVDADNGDTLDDARALDAPPGTRYWEPAYRGDGMLVVAVQTETEEPGHYEGSQGLVLDPATGEAVATFSYDGNVYSQRYDPTGTWLLVTYDDGRVVWMGGGQTDVVPGTYLHATW